MNVVDNGLIVVVKRDCPTCLVLDEALGELVKAGVLSAVYSQDDPSFPEAVAEVADDRELEASYRLGIEIVPTLIRLANGKEEHRVEGWNRADWEQALGIDGLAPDLPAHRPGCGSLSVGPGMPEKLAYKFGDTPLQARAITIGSLEDEMELCFERGWSDGLPVVPPTPERVLAMLDGTTREAGEIVGIVPPDLAECTVEKVAINAVMAGCKPEYLPTVLAAVEAALQDEFCMHGLLCTTMFSGPVMVVNGPVRRRIAMNSGVNALGQGTRANASIGRALQLLIRNVGGGRPGEIDRATLGNPGKFTFCIAEDEESSDWESLAVERGFAADADVVSLFTGNGVQGVVDQKSREPESLARTFAACMRTVNHPKIAMAGDMLLVISPEHARTLRNGGWSKQRFKDELIELLTIPGEELIIGAGGMAEGIPEKLKDRRIPKIRPGGLDIVRAGGGAGMFSAIIPGWLASGEKGSVSVSRQIGG